MSSNIYNGYEYAWCETCFRYIRREVCDSFTEGKWVTFGWHSNIDDLKTFTDKTLDDEEENPLPAITMRHDCVCYGDVD